MTSFSVRPMREADVEAVVQYWTTASPSDLERMGVNAAALDPPDMMREGYRRALARPECERKAFALVWEVDGEAIGFTTLKNIERGVKGEMHLHIWKETARGKGYGGKLFCLAALDFYERFQLKEIVCEPRSTNPMPNRMLQRVGFPLVRTYVGQSSELAQVCELNTYAILRDVAARHLAMSS